MSFKDDVLEDMKKTFFDLDEFAEIHEFNGKKLVASVDEHELMKRDRRSGKSLEELQAIMEPKLYVGRSPEQTEEFVRDYVQPILDAHKDELGMTAVISV